VGKGAQLEANFGHRPFEFGPPEKFEGIMFTRDLV
jgi:hypothetical protein